MDAVRAMTAHGLAMERICSGRGQTRLLSTPLDFLDVPPVVQRKKESAALASNRTAQANPWRMLEKAVHTHVGTRAVEHARVVRVAA